MDSRRSVSSRRQTEGFVYDVCFLNMTRKPAHKGVYAELKFSTGDAQRNRRGV